MSTNPADPKSPFFKLLYPALIKKPVEQRKVRDLEQELTEIDLVIEGLRRKLNKVNQQLQDIWEAKEWLKKHSPGIFK